MKINIIQDSHGDPEQLARTIAALESRGYEVQVIPVICRCGILPAPLDLSRFAFKVQQGPEKRALKGPLVEDPRMVTVFENGELTEAGKRLLKR